MLTCAPLLKAYDSQSVDYHRAFKVFLDHTDQKTRARTWLNRLVKALPSRQVFIDAGAGNGRVTAWFLNQFERTIAIEPNPSLRDELSRTCPGVEILPEKILAAHPAAHADLVLCSHVLYYIDHAQWLDHFAGMASWLSPGGVLVVVLQNRNSDCMRMLDHFLSRHFDLTGPVQQFQKEWGHRYTVATERVPAHIATPDLASAYTIAEFVLNLLPPPEGLLRRELEEYVEEHFIQTDGSFRFSCDQDFVRIEARA
jgi:SAM-dependent methyltransferase